MEGCDNNLADQGTSLKLTIDRDNDKNPVVALREDDADYATLRIYAASDDLVPDPEDEAGQSLSAAVNGIGARNQPGLYGGAARIAFSIAHLSDGEDADTACEMIERSLLRFVAIPGDLYDLIGGLAGIAMPVLQRIIDRFEDSERVLSALAYRKVLPLKVIERLARPMPKGIAWYTPPALLPAWQREIAPEGYYNLGLAHGIPGIVGILARYITAGIEVERARRLLEGAVAYLGAMASPRFGNRYPAWLAMHHQREAVSRVAWCYGDLGVAVAILAAAIATGRADWYAQALDLAHGMAERPFENSQVVDAGLCHGASGVAHLFNRLFQATGDARFGRAAEAWYGHTLAMRNTEPIAGFPRNMLVGEQMTWDPGADMLTGACGVGLALHAAISSVEPAWDRLLFADLAPASASAIAPAAAAG